jgi:hypothetical protein
LRLDLSVKKFLKLARLTSKMKPMNLATEKKLTPIAHRMTKGTAPSDSEIRLLRGAAGEVQDREFKALLQKAGTETTLPQRRQVGKHLLNNIRFATGARRKNDLPPDNPRPDKIKRWLARPAVLAHGYKTGKERFG